MRVTMNNLNRAIEEGEKIVLKKELFVPALRSLEWRTVTALGGFGMLTGTSGRAIFVRFNDGRTARFDGTDISVSETNLLKEGKSW
jgi:hypothetical protein